MEIHLGAAGIDVQADVRLTRRGERWVAVASIAGEHTIGIGPTAHQALGASLAFLPRDSAAALLADPGLMEASAEVL